MIHDATSVPTTYELRFSGCSVLFFVMATVVAVEEISQPTAPAAMIPHLVPNTRERINQAYSIPAIRTTKNQILYGLKNLTWRTSQFQSSVHE
jgi:hypothetical protein